MNKMNFTPTVYWSGAVIFLSFSLLSGCATEIRYDENIRTYSSAQSGVKSTIGRYDYAAASSAAGSETQSHPTTPRGIKTTAGKYDDVTAHYILRDGGASVPQSTVIVVAPESQAEDFPMKMVMVLEVSDVLFEFNKWVIKEPYLPEMNKWVDYFHSHPQATARIYGHTDSIGSAAYNQKLSLKRAQAVINYLLEEGVNPNRLTAGGFGESQPTAPNSTREGRQKNRRVEMNF